jgi:hypothetical protein
MKMTGFIMKKKELNISLVVFEFDGVLTDNRVLVFDDGREAVFFVVADRSFSLKLKFKIFAAPFSLLLELPLLATAWPCVLSVLNTKLKAPCGRVY